MSGWTDEAIDRLKRLWAAGRSGSDIAEELGFSRSAILGKIHRLGLSNRVATRKKAAISGSVAVSGIATKTARGFRGMQGVRAKRKAAAVSAARKEPELPAPTFIGAKHFADLLPGECAFPIDDDGIMRCAAPTLEGKSYCCHHHALCHAKSKPGKLNWGGM